MDKSLLFRWAVETVEPGCVSRGFALAEGPAQPGEHSGQASLGRLAVIHRSAIFLSRNQEAWLHELLGLLSGSRPCLFSSLKISHFAQGHHRDECGKAQCWQAFQFTAAFNVESHLFSFLSRCYASSSGQICSPI